jgi:lipopolysaccharide transport protein LptA
MAMVTSLCIARPVLRRLSAVATTAAAIALALASFNTATGATASTAAERTPRPSCDSVNLDFRGKASFERNHQVIHDVRMTLTEADCQVSLTVTADVAEAGGKYFSNNDTWTVSGHVVVTMPEGELRADSAKVVLVGGLMKQATVRGVPATFVQATQPGANSAASARGQAAIISYDAASADLELQGDVTGNARLQDDSRQLNHQRIVYNLRQHTMQAGSSDPNSRGTITIKRPPKSTP